MPVATQDRPIAALREETIDRLIVNYGHGKLSLEAFERRLDEALDAKTHDTLLALTADLELSPEKDKVYAETKRAEFGQRADQSSRRNVAHIVNIFGGTNRRGMWTVPEEIRMVSVFGGGDLDFSSASFSARETHITLFCLFGGANFYVSENINTICNVVAIFGGVDNRAPANPDPNAPTIVINGFVLFGGATVRIRKSLKERWLEFADHVKSAFGPIHHHY